MSDNKKSCRKVDQMIEQTHTKYVGTELADGHTMLNLKLYLRMELMCETVP